MAEYHSREESPERLTEDVCDSIMYAAGTVMDETIVYGKYFYLSYIRAEVESTGYMPLYELYQYIVDELAYMKIPTFHEVYTNIVSGEDDETWRAERLENDLYRCFKNGMEDTPDDYPDVGSELDISLNSFQRIESFLHEFLELCLALDDKVSEAFSYREPIPKHFERPLYDAMGRYSDDFYYLMSRCLEQLDYICSNFKTGIEEAMTQAESAQGGSLDAAVLRWKL